MLSPRLVLFDLALTFCLAGAGVIAAWLIRRRSSLSARNFYPPAGLAALLAAVCIATQQWVALMVVAPIGAPWIAGALLGRRWRLVDLGAGEELRGHELERRWLWEPAPQRVEGERKYLRSQGELVHERPWPRSVEYVSMSHSASAAPGCRSAPASTSSRSEPPAPARRPPRGG